MSAKAGVKTVPATPASGQAQFSPAEVLSKAFEQYLAKTPGKLKAIDAFLLYVMLTGIFQFVVCRVVFSAVSIVCGIEHNLAGIEIWHAYLINIALHINF